MPDPRPGPPPSPPAPSGADADWPRRIGVDPAALAAPEFRELYPFSPHFFAVPGGRIHYVDEGAGEPVVMVHGNPTWSFFYRDLIKRLRGARRCLALDHLGCGLSDKPRDEAHYCLESHIDNLEAWLEATLPPPGQPGGKIDLVVHDWGGPIGIGYAIRRRERIRRLVVLNTSVFTDGDMPLRIKLCRWPGLGRVLVRGLNLFALGATRMTTAKPLPAPVRRGFVLPYNSWANRVAVYGFIADIPLSPTMPTYRVLAEIDAEVADALRGVPILIQWGMRDWCFTPFFLDLWERRFPGALVDRRPAGHYLLEDAGEAIFPRVLEFLSNTSLS